MHALSEVRTATTSLSMHSLSERLSVVWGNKVLALLMLVQVVIGLVIPWRILLWLSSGPEEVLKVVVG